MAEGEAIVTVLRIFFYNSIQQSCFRSSDILLTKFQQNFYLRATWFLSCKTRNSCLKTHILYRTSIVFCISIKTACNIFTDTNFPDSRVAWIFSSNTLLGSSFSLISLRSCIYFLMSFVSLFDSFDPSDRQSYPEAASLGLHGDHFLVLWSPPAAARWSPGILLRFFPSSFLKFLGTPLPTFVALCALGYKDIFRRL